jgi:hypothetical protein
MARPQTGNAYKLDLLHYHFRAMFYQPAIRAELFTACQHQLCYEKKIAVYLVSIRYDLIILNTLDFNCNP